MNKKVIAVDIGASSGKMAFGEFDGSQLLVREYRDFANRPVDIGTALYWDVFSLHNAIVDGMAYFKEKYGEADVVAVDTWGASYGLLDKKGRLMEPVYHYRDERTRTTIQDMNSGYIRAVQVNRMSVQQNLYITAVIFLQGREQCCSL